jgi:hypothetical protein
VQLSERAAAEADIGPVRHRCLISAQPGRIQGPEQRVIPAGGSVLAGAGDPFPQEAEEVFQPLGSRRRAGRPGVRAGMPGGVELIGRVGQPDAERGLDRGGLARDREPVEVLERPHMQTAGGGRQPPGRELADDPVDVLPGYLPGRAAAGGREAPQRARPVSGRLLAEAARNLRGPESPQALLLESRRVRRRHDRLRRRARCPAPHHPQPVSVHLRCSRLEN